MPQKLRALLAATFVVLQQLPSFERAAHAHSRADRENSKPSLAQFPALPMLMMVDPRKQEAWKDLAQRLLDNQWDVTNNIDLACTTLPELPSADIRRIACIHRLALTLAYDSDSRQTKAAENLLSNCTGSFDSSSLKDRTYLANCYYDIGMLLLQQESWPEALENLNKALTIFQNSDQTDSTALADTYYGLGICYAKLGRGSKSLAIDAFSNAGKAYEQLVNQSTSVTTLSARRISMICLAESALYNASALASQIDDWNRAQELSKQGLVISDLRKDIFDLYRPGFFYTLAQALKSKGDLVGAASAASKSLAFFGLDPDKPALRQDPFVPIEGGTASNPAAEVSTEKKSSCALCLIKSLSLGTEKLSYDMTRTAVACAEPIPPPNFAVFPLRLDIPLSDSRSEEPDEHVLDSKCLVPNAGSNDSFPAESSDEKQPIRQNNLIARSDAFASNANDSTAAIEPYRKPKDSETTKSNTSESSLLVKLFKRADLHAQTIPSLDRSSPGNMIRVFLDSSSPKEKSQELSRLEGLANLFTITGGTSDQVHSQKSASDKPPDAQVPSDSNSNYLLGQLATIMADHEAAVKLFQSASDLDPSNDRKKKSLAAIYHRLSQSPKNSPDKNLELSQIASFWDPENSILVSALNTHIQENGRDPSAFEDRIKLSNAASNKGSFRAAIAECEAALKIKDDHDSRLKLGDLYRQIGEHDRAILEYQLAGLDNNNGRPLVKLGLIYKEKGDLINEIKFFQQASEILPPDQTSANLLNESWQSAARLAPSAWENHAGLGQSYRDLGNLGQAEAEFRIALTLSPNNKAVENLLKKQPSTAKKPDASSMPAVRTDERSTNQADSAVERAANEFRKAISCEELTKLLPAGDSKPPTGGIDSQTSTAAQQPDTAQTTLSPVLREPSIQQDNDVDFGPYMADLQHRIKRVWFPPKSSTSTQVVVTFEIGRLGDLSKLKVDQSSGLSEADRAGLRAVENAAPFRVLPAGSPDTVKIQYTFDRNVPTDAEPTDSFSAGTPTGSFHTYLAPPEAEATQGSLLDILLKPPRAPELDKSEVKLSVPQIPTSLILPIE
jgi:TonB family protein